MNFRQIETFLLLAQNNSFSKTAKELYLTQPTVSSNISLLEKELGVRLFIRNTKDVEITKDGEKLYPYAKQLMNMAEDIKFLFNDDEKEDNSPLLLSSSSIPSTYILPDMLAKFSELYPNIKFTLKTNDSLGVINDVKERKVKLGFCGTIEDRKYCRYIPFFTDKLVIAMPNTAKYQYIAKMKDINSILKESFIIREEGSGTRKETKKRLKENNIDFDSLNIVATLNSTQAIIRSIKSGIGISIISELAILDEIKKENLITMELEGKEREFYVVYNINDKLSKSAKKMIQLIKNNFDNGNYVI